MNIKISGNIPLSAICFAVFYQVRLQRFITDFDFCLRLLEEKERERERWNVFKDASFTLFMHLIAVIVQS